MVLAKDIRAREADVLKALDFNLGRPFSLTFLRRITTIGASEDVVSAECHNLAKVSLLAALADYSMAHVLPSKVAAAALLLAVRVTRGTAH